MAGKKADETLMSNMNGAEKGFDGDQSRRAFLRTRDRYPPAPPKKIKEYLITDRKNEMCRTYNKQKQQVANLKLTKKGFLP